MIKKTGVGKVKEGDAVVAYYTAPPSGNKEMYDQGKLWGTWADKKEGDFFSGDPVVIKSNGTWSIKGRAEKYKVEWDGESIINIKDDNNNSFTTFIDEKTIETIREADGRKWTLTKTAEAAAKTKIDDPWYAYAGTCTGVTSEGIEITYANGGSVLALNGRDKVWKLNPM